LLPFEVMRRGSLLLAVGLVSSVPLRARADDIFAACQADAVARGGWKAVCKDWVLSLADGRVRPTAEDALRVMEKALAELTGGQVSRAPGDAGPLGKGWTVTELKVEGSKESDPRFALVGDRRLAEGTRLLTCTGPSASKDVCKRAMQVAARTAWLSGPPAGLARDQSGPTFAGRPYRVPKGCEVMKQPHATAIGCAGHPVLFWTDHPLAAVESAMTENILGSGMKEGGPVPCSIEGVSAKCRPFLPTAASDARSAYMGRATVRGQLVMVLCLVESRTGPLPAPCAEVLTVTR
jgi:hypothetical protein